MVYSPQCGGYKSGLPSELSEYSATGGRRRTRRSTRRRRSMRGGWAEAFASPISSSKSISATSPPPPTVPRSSPATMPIMSDRKQIDVAKLTIARDAATRDSILARQAKFKETWSKSPANYQGHLTKISENEKKWQDGLSKVKAEYDKNKSPAAYQKVLKYEKGVNHFKTAREQADKNHAKHVENLSKAVEITDKNMRQAQIDASKQALKLEKLTGAPAVSFLPEAWKKDGIITQGGGRRRSRKTRKSKDGK